MKKIIKYESFLKYKSVKGILGENYNLTDEQKVGLVDYFGEYGYITSRDVFTRLAHFTLQGVCDYVSYQKILLKYNRMSIEYFRTLYGEESGNKRWQEVRQNGKNNLRNCIDHWMLQGFTKEESELHVIKHQKKASAIRISGNNSSSSVRCIEYWIKKGFTSDDARILVQIIQTRDLDFYIYKYGETEGQHRYKLSADRKIATWEKKSEEEMKLHYLKTLPRKFNIHGQEMQAIRMFLDQNNIDEHHCMFGTPADQFFQWIPSVGFRRYDLAVFWDADKKNLKYIMEFHGPGHINFSDFNESMKDENITIKGKRLWNLGTYGESYSNDMAKREQVLNKYKDVRYFVFWHHNLKNKEFRINDL